MFSSRLYQWWLALDGDVSFHGFKGSGRLLDIGCNEGRGLRIYESNGFYAEGLELNEKAAAEARARGFKVHADMLEEFLPEQSYDTVVMSNVLEHSLQPKEMLKHATRILKPGGQIWVSCPNVDSWLRVLFGRAWINWHVPFHIVHFSEDTLRDMLEDSGFMDITIRQETPAHWFAQSAIAYLFARKGQR
ncbi:MAG: class I SAM-dependent methyltransferase, partial [Deltaproteobacteria bacterium]|nr:class I SAM-dependent methyltransferase [Deltaproteobacteria bacterium]